MFDWTQVSKAYLAWFVAVLLPWLFPASGRKRLASPSRREPATGRAATTAS